jgi:hypothetical protein
VIPNDERRVLISLKIKGKTYLLKQKRFLKELTKNIEFDNLNQLRDELKVLVNLLSENLRPLNISDNGSPEPLPGLSRSFYLS